MTKAEYAREYRQARRETARLVISGRHTIRREYIKVFSRIARVIRENKHKPFLEEQIRSAFPRKELFDFLMRFIMDGRGKAVKLTADINKRYILEALQKVPGHGLSVEKISRLFDGIAEKRGRGNESAVNPATGPRAVPLLNANRHKHIIPKRSARPCTGRHAHTVVKNARSRTYHGQSSGEPHTFTFQPYSLSKSVWGAVGDTEEKIMNVVWGGISQGRDVRGVSADLMAYLKGGPEIVKGRWGKLRPDSQRRAEGIEAAKTAGLNPRTKAGQQFITEFIKTRTPAESAYARRLGSKGVDYRAARLYRSEIHRNQQEAAVEEGKDNPACTGEYDWILMPGRGTFTCDCPEIAEGGPYTKDELAEIGYPHPNCFPAGTMILMADGTEKPIEKIEKGDYVMGMDKSPQLVIRTIKQKYEGAFCRITTLGLEKPLIVTPDHPVLMFAGEYRNWVYRPAYMINKEDLIATLETSAFSTTGIVTESSLMPHESTTVYNLTTIPDHNYVANRIIVHNCDCMVEPILKDFDDLIKELQAYVKGDPEGNDIALWAQNNGLAAEATVGMKVPGDVDGEPGHRGDITQIQEDIKQLVGIESVDLTGVDKELAGGLYDGYKTVLDRYPVLRGQFRLLGINENRYDISASTYPNTGEININLQFFGMSKKSFEKWYALLVYAGFYPKGTIWKSAILHEIGHRVDGYLTKKVLGRDWDYRKDYYSNNRLVR
jgi:hypothetical protein